MTLTCNSIPSSWALPLSVDDVENYSQEGTLLSLRAEWQELLSWCICTCQLCLDRNGPLLLTCVSRICVKPLSCQPVRLCLGLPGHFCPAASQARGRATGLSRGVSCPKWDMFKRECANTWAAVPNTRTHILAVLNLHECISQLVFLFSSVSVRRCL